MQVKNNLKKVSLFLLVVGLAFIVGNFVAPHTLLTPKSVTVATEVPTTHEQILGSNRVSIEDDSYEAFPTVYLEVGQTFKVSWDSLDHITGYILTQDQFNDFLANYSSSPQKNTYPDPIPHKASATQNRNGALFYNVTQSGNYVALFRTALNTANVFLEESILTYTYRTQYTPETQMVPQNDNLYLIFGAVLVVGGVLSLIISLNLQKAGER